MQLQAADATRRYPRLAFRALTLLATRPARRTLFDEGAHAFVEVGAAVGLRRPGRRRPARRVLPGFAAPPPSSTHSVIGACEATVSASSRTRASIASSARRSRGRSRRRALRRQSISRAVKISSFSARRPEQVEVARVRLHRQAVAERARDRRAEARIGRRDAQVAAPAAMPKPPPTAKPWICAMTGLLHAREPIRHAVALALVAQAVVAALEAVNWPMSVPATNALPPAPLSTRTRTESSASTSLADLVRAAGTSPRSSRCAPRDG